MRGGPQVSQRILVVGAAGNLGHVDHVAERREGFLGERLRHDLHIVTP